MVDAVEHLHQLITVCSGLYVIKQIQLRDAGRGEIVQHDAGFGIAMAGDPDPVQRSDCSSNNVPGVPCGCHQFLCCQIAIVGLVDGERRRFNEGRDMPAVLVLSAQLRKRRNNPTCYYAPGVAMLLLLNINTEQNHEEHPHA